MKILKVAAAYLCLFFVFAAACPGQKNSAEIYVESWSTDNIVERKFKFDIDSSQDEYSEFVPRSAGNGYRLTLKKMPAGKETYKLEYWVVSLQEILSKKYAKKEKLGCNLLTREGCGIGDYFPREDLIGILYPRETARTNAEKYLVQEYYPISARRVIKVKSFYVIINVNDYKMSESDPRKIDSMNVTIEVKRRLPSYPVYQVSAK